MGKCNHKDKSGKSLIKDNVCTKCGTEFGPNFFKKQQDKHKRNKKNNKNIELY